MKIHNAILLLVTSLLVFSNSVYSEIVSPKIIQNDNKIKEIFTSRGGMEGWSWVSFMVGLDGTPSDIIVIDYSGQQRYIKSSVDYVKNLTFSPATVNGVPTIGERDIFLPHSFSGSGYNVGKVTPVFARDYQEILDTINSLNGISTARTLIDKLKEDHTKSLYEHAMAAYLESLYSYKNQNFLEYMRQSQIALNLHEYLPLKMLSNTVVNLFEAQLYYGYFTEAEDTLWAMKKIEGLNLSDELAEDFQNQLKNKINSNLPIKVKGKLTPLGSWIYYNNFQKFKITKVNGVIDSVELRCIGLHQKYSTDLQKELEIPTSAKRCVTMVQGQKGTTFELIQIST